MARILRSRRLSQALFPHQPSPLWLPNVTLARVWPRGIQRATINALDLFFPATFFQKIAAFAPLYRSSGAVDVKIVMWEERRSRSRCDEVVLAIAELWDSQV
jgi:hypothetical protein